MAYYHVKDDLTFNEEENVILRGSRIVIHKILQERVLQIGHEGHQYKTVTKGKGLVSETD